MLTRLLKLIVLAWLSAGGFGTARAAMEISSPDFAPGQPIPAKYAKAGQNLSPALRIKGVPEATKTLILVMEDPDAPPDGAFSFTHWIVLGIDPHHALFQEGRAPRGAVMGVNTQGDTHYDGPAPPSGRHRYVFHLYALNAVPVFPPRANRAAVERAIFGRGRVIEEATTMGTYQAK